MSQKRNQAVKESRDKSIDDQLYLARFGQLFITNPECCRVAQRLYNSIVTSEPGAPSLRDPADKIVEVFRQACEISDASELKSMVTAFACIVNPNDPVRLKAKFFAAKLGIKDIKRLKCIISEKIDPKTGKFSRLSKQDAVAAERFARRIVHDELGFASKRGRPKTK